MTRRLDESKLTPLGHRIVALTRSRGHKTLKSAARAGQVDYQQLKDLIHGKRNPQLSTVMRIVTGLGGEFRYEITPQTLEFSAQTPSTAA